MSAFREKIEAAGLRPPGFVTLMMTNGCNLECSHCWPESRNVESVQPVPSKTLIRLIHELAALQVRGICLTGGEPLTHPDWYDILAHACGQKEFNRITLQTNAVLLGDDTIRKLREMDCRRLVVQVSLEGACNSTHDQVRGEGSFERAFAGLRRLAEAGLGRQTQVAFTEMRHNFMDLPLLLELAEDLGLSGVISGTLVSQGRARKSIQIAPPTTSQYEQLLNLYESDPVFRSRYERLANIAALEWFKGRAHSTAPGCVCMETPLVDAQGRVYPCHFMPAPAFAVGGGHDRSLESVILDALDLWARLPAMDLRRRQNLQPCKTCPGKGHCAGGCLGRAYAASGDFKSVEDRCELRKVVYSWASHS